MDRASIIRRELQEAERICNRYSKQYLLTINLTGLTGPDNIFYNAYVHFQGRRRFFLRDLLKVQLKEFDRG